MGLYTDILSKLGRSPQCFDDEIIRHINRCIKIDDKIPSLIAQQPILVDGIDFGSGTEYIIESFGEKELYQSENYGNDVLEVYGYNSDVKKNPVQIFFFFYNNHYIMAEIVMGMETIPRPRVFGDVVFRKNYSSLMDEQLAAYCAKFSSSLIPKTIFTLKDHNNQCLLVLKTKMKTFMLHYPPLPPPLVQLLTTNKHCKKILSRENGPSEPSVNMVL